jgi:hypothetical protein
MAPTLITKFIRSLVRCSFSGGGLDFALQIYIKKLVSQSPVFNKSFFCILRWQIATGNKKMNHSHPVSYWYLLSEVFFKNR